MLFRITLAATLVFSLSLAGYAFAEPNMQDGMWEITMKTEMPGMPMAIPPVKFNQCLTKKDLIPQKRKKNEDCKMVSTKIDGNTVSWVVKCRTKDGTIDSTGKVTYRGGGFDGVINAVMNDSRSGKMEMISYMSGQRVGDCKH
ncbi:MAG: DUF3617 domain-containing protein [Nitrospirae bacterium]|nr:DUF3617 domain-containing protein [Nitrospirota bacterium]